MVLYYRSLTVRAVVRAAEGNEGIIKSERESAMRTGFIVPTEMEAVNLPLENRHITCAGYGAGKTAACSAAADLIFNKYCDTVIIWGLAGALAPDLGPGDLVVGRRVAYRDYDIHPLQGSTGVGWVQGFAENIFADLDSGFCDVLEKQLKETFPGRKVRGGTICSGDQFISLKPGDERNRVERESDAVDMESAAVVHFCRNLKRGIKVGIIRVISDNADHNAVTDFQSFLNSFAEMNGKLFQLRRGLLAECQDGSGEILSAIRDFQDFPVPGVLFKDIWGIFRDRSTLEAACYSMYDRFHLENPGLTVTKVAGVESRGFIFGAMLAGMFGVPFVPLRKKGKLPGSIAADTYRTEYSESTLEAQKSAFCESDRVLLVDDIIATGGSLLAARNVIRKCGAECVCCLALGQIRTLNGAGILRENGMAVTFLLEL